LYRYDPGTFVLFHYEQRAMHYLYQSKVWRRAVKGDAYKVGLCTSRIQFITHSLKVT
jgi:hypothetical protein